MERVGVMPRAFFERMTRGYESFNVALKARAEARYRLARCMLAGLGGVLSAG